MNTDFLDFEQPIVELLAKINELHRVSHENKLNLTDEIERLERKINLLTKTIFAALTPIQIVRLARHQQRPHSMDYIQRIFTEFDELYGDRSYAKGSAIIGGIARLNNQPVVVIGQQKGRNTKENIARNFAMPKPEEYRKALRLMKLAEKFQLPIITLIDTPGAYPGIDAEEHNQSEAIARNLFTMARLATPIICTIIGEGGSGGALALGVGDRVLMFEYSIYATISPEGCASILWRNQGKISEAAAALNLTAHRLHQLKLIDQVIPEPLGGAHRNYDVAAKSLMNALTENLQQLTTLPTERLVELRYTKLMSYGVVK